MEFNQADKGDKQMMTKKQYEKWLKVFETMPRNIQDGEPSDASGFTNDIEMILIKE